MDNDIKRLLKLEQIPGFVLLDQERKKLEEWKKNQKRVKPIKRERHIPEGLKEMEMGSGDTPTLIKEDALGPVPEEVKVVKNVVDSDEKTSGSVEKG